MQRVRRLVCNGKVKEFGSFLITLDTKNLVIRLQRVGKRIRIILNYWSCKELKRLVHNSTVKEFGNILNYSPYKELGNSFVGALKNSGWFFKPETLS